MFNCSACEIYTDLHSELDEKQNNAWKYFQRIQEAFCDEQIFETEGND